MPSKKISYNPSLSISENAARNGVTEDAIRYYIKRNNINRRDETKVGVINECRKALQDKPTATPYMVARMTKHSINTVKKYWDLILGENEVELSNYGRKKTPKIDTPPKGEFLRHPSILHERYIECGRVRPRHLGTVLWVRDDGRSNQGTRVQRQGL